MSKTDSPATDRPVVIIGGGIGGLATGCYLAMNGYQTTILEQGGMCGGVSVAWKRGDYLFDGATNWLPGSAPTLNIHDVLRELIDFSHLTIYDSDEFMTVEQDGYRMVVYTDARRFGQELRGIAPQDGKLIDEMVAAIMTAATFDIPFDKAPEVYSPLDFLLFPLKNRRFLQFFFKWRGMSIERFARRFQSPALRILLQKIFPHHEFFSVFGLLMALGWMHARSGGYPMGGSNNFAAQLENKYASLGGVVRLHTTVTTIRVENGVATGVVCDNGDFIPARYVVAACDGHRAIYDMLGGRFESRAIHRLYTQGTVLPSVIQVSVGIKRGFEGAPHKIHTQLTAPLDVGDGQTISDMLVRICNFDPCFAPPGKTSIVVHLRIPTWNYWQELRGKDRQKYRQEKERVAQAVIAALDKRFGNVAGLVETVDVATPASFIRYTGIWQGSYQGFAPVPGLVGRTLPKTLPGLKKFYLAGQWVWPAGGLPGVIRIGRHVAQMICRADHRHFRVDRGADA